MASDTIELMCLKCGRMLRAAGRLRGRMIRCPGCDATRTVPLKEMDPRREVSPVVGRVVVGAAAAGLLAVGALVGLGWWPSATPAARHQTGEEQTPDARFAAMARRVESRLGRLEAVDGLTVVPGVREETWRKEDAMMTWAGVLTFQLRDRVGATTVLMEVTAEYEYAGARWTLRGAVAKLVEAVGDVPEAARTRAVGTTRTLDLDDGSDLSRVLLEG